MSNQRLKNILCFTGGVDSLVAWYYLNKPSSIYFDLKHRYNWKEKRTIAEIAEKTGMKLIIDESLDLSKWEQLDATIPMRNMLLAMLASNYADTVYLITQLGEFELADRSPDFLKKCGGIISSLQEREIKVETPFLTMTKQDMVKWFKENHEEDLSILKMARSCYDKEQDECGSCSACFRKWVAFEYNDIEIDYKDKILAWDGIQKYAERINAGKYNEIRAEQTISVFKKVGII